jgi:hypothetical protein
MKLTLSGHGLEVRSNFLVDLGHSLLGQEVSNDAPASELCRTFRQANKRDCLLISEP